MLDDNNYYKYQLLNFSEIVENSAGEEQEPVQAEVTIASVGHDQSNARIVMTDNTAYRLGTLQGSAPAAYHDAKRFGDTNIDGAAGMGMGFDMSSNSAYASTSLN